MSPIQTNRTNLVRMSVTGNVVHPRFNSRTPYRISIHGEPRVLPGTGGVTYNVRVGTRVDSIVGDHVEPGISMKHPDTESNGGLNVLACIGNRAEVLTGKASGDVGVVTGKHGGAEHVMVDFPDEILEKMVPGDRILVRSFGVGLELPEFPDIKCMSLDPDFFDEWITESRDGKLVVPVSHKVPAGVMGSGLGRDNAFRETTTSRCSIRRSSRSAGWTRYGSAISSRSWTPIRPMAATTTPARSRSGSSPMATRSSPATALASPASSPPAPARSSR
ncbi:MAG: DUF4438 domain-containing protein [Thermomicrobiales bacterium]